MAADAAATGLCRAPCRRRPARPPRALPGAPGGTPMERPAARSRGGRGRVVIEAEEHSLEPLHAVLDGELLPLRALARVGLQRQLALLQLEVLDDEDDRYRE